MKGRQVRSHPVAEPSVAGPGVAGWRSRLLPGGALLLLALVCYGPSYQAGFIWDDDIMTSNSPVRGGWAGLRDIWFTGRYGDYVPLTATTFWLEWQMAGVSQELRHLTNILLHAANGLLVWRVLRHLGVPGAWGAAALFAVHPMGVTSVTWVAERKNTLSMLFYLLSLLHYLRAGLLGGGAAAGSSGGFRWRGLPGSYWLAFGFFILALLSKSSVVVLPVVLLLCAWWRHGRLTRASVLPVAPFFGFALAVGLATVVAHHFFAPKLGIVAVSDSLLVRSLAGARAVWFYLGHAFWPAHLTMHYPRWEVDPASPWAWLPALGLMAVLAWCWKHRQGWGRAALFVAGYYLVALGPALGVLKMTYLKYSQVAEHFHYLALPGLAAGVAGGVWWRAGAASPRVRQCVRAAFGVLLVVLAGLCWQFQRVVGSAERLWADNLRQHPQSWVAHNNLGNEHNAQGRPVPAEEHYRAALALKPDAYEIHYGLGRALIAQRRFAEAAAALRDSLRLFPGNGAAHNNLAGALQHAGTPEEVLFHLREAVRLNPYHTDARVNLGLLLARRGQWPEALEQFRGALQGDPDSLPARQNLGLLLAAGGSLQEARAHLARALQLDASRTLAFVREASVKAGAASLPLVEALAWACADVGRVTEADALGQQAARMAEAAGKAGEAARLRQRFGGSSPGQTAP